MKQRKSTSIILLRERRLSQSIRRRSGKIAVTVIAQHFLEIYPGGRQAIEISIAFAERKISVCATGTTRIVIEIFLIFRDCQVVKFASEQRVGIIELAAVRGFAFAHGWLGRLFSRRGGFSCRRLL